MLKTLRKYSSITFLPNYELRNAIGALSSEISGSVLDIGCGAKPYENLFNCDVYIGIDTENSGHNHLNSKVDIYYDGLTLPFSNEKFDSILAFQVLEHVEDVEMMLSEMLRVMKKSGKLLLTVPLIWPEHEIPYDFYRWSSFGIRTLLKKNGFEILWQGKVGSTSTVLGALFLNSLNKKSNLINKIMTRFIALVVNVLCLIFSYFSKSTPDSKETYFDNIVLVRK